MNSENKDKGVTTIGNERLDLLSESSFDFNVTKYWKMLSKLPISQSFRHTIVVYIAHKQVKICNSHIYWSQKVEKFIHTNTPFSDEQASN